MSKTNLAFDVGRCFQHFLKNVPAAVAIITKLTDTKTEKSVVKWWKDRKPKGYDRVKILYFLANNGYCVKEWQELHEEVKRFTPVLVFDLMDRKAIATELGYETKRPDDELLDYYRPHSTQWSTRFLSLREFNDVHAAEFTPTIAARLQEEIQHKDIVAIAQKLYNDPNAAPLKKDDIGSLYILIQQILPLARRLASDAATLEDREKFRAMFPKFELLEVKEWITALLSEEVRKSIFESRERNSL